MEYIEVKCPGWRLLLILKNLQRKSLTQKLLKEPGKEDFEKIVEDAAPNLSKKQKEQAEIGIYEGLSPETRGIYDWLRNQVVRYGDISVESVNNYLEGLKNHIMDCDSCFQKYNRFVWEQIDNQNLKTEDANEKAKKEDEELLDILNIK
jgi:hypothetical protein